jgi:hypothetical protein
MIEQLYSQLHFHGRLQYRVEVAVCQFILTVYFMSLVKFIEIRNVTPLSNTQEAQISSAHHTYRRGSRYISEGEVDQILSQFLYLELKNGSISETLNSFNVLTLLVPMSQAVATTCSPEFRQAPRISFKNCTIIAAFVLP